jgi:alpha-glucosidase
LVGHANVGWLMEQQRTLVADMTKNDVKPQKIMLTVKDRNPGNLSTINTIYNKRKKYRRSVKGPRTEMQHLMNLLVNDNYVYSYRNHEDTKVVKDIF